MIERARCDMAPLPEPPAAAQVASANAAPPPAPLAIRPVRRWLPWVALMALLTVAQTLLVVLTMQYEGSRQEERAEAAAAAAASQLRLSLAREVQGLQALLWQDGVLTSWRQAAGDWLRQRRLPSRAEWRDATMALVEAIDSPLQPPLFRVLGRAQLELDTLIACTAAGRRMEPTFSRSYFVPQSDGRGVEVLDVCVPVVRDGEFTGFMTVTFALVSLLEEAARAEPASGHELELVEADGSRLATFGAQRGSRVYVAERVVDLAGQRLQLRADSVAGRPSLVPNLATALVLGLSVALFAVVLLLARDVRRRARAEAALAESLAFRRAMEDSLVTGLRARDLDGRLTHANPAFCAMVGWSLDELRASATPPYWPPEMVDTYRQRLHLRRRRLLPSDEAREGIETVYQRRDGTRLPVRVYEAPLVDTQGRHTGWMSSVLDLSAQRRAEDLARAQQERLQASARLATVGEMASLLSHELNQPLSAIASYATGSLNLIDAQAQATARPPAPASEPLVDLLRQALSRIAEQAERAGRVIKSVHGFVRRRDAARQGVRASDLFEAVMPLIRLQARKSGTRIELDVPQPPPRARCDRTMVEQVLLNLARNAIQAMENGTPLAERVLTLRARSVDGGQRVEFSVVDRGSGIAPDVAAQLFTPFFTTRGEGMGLGLSLCRTVVEQHGGVLEFSSRTRDEAAQVGPDGTGTQFRFTLPSVSGVREAAATTPPPTAHAAPARAGSTADESFDQPADGVPRR